MLCFSDIAAIVLKELFTELLLSDSKIKFGPSLEGDLSNRLSWLKCFLTCLMILLREKVEALIRVLNKNCSLAKSNRSLKLFSHLMASAETTQECLLALLNIKVTMRPGTMRDKYMNVGHPTTLDGRKIP